MGLQAGIKNINLGIGGCIISWRFGRNGYVSSYQKEKKETVCAMWRLLSIQGISTAMSLYSSFHTVCILYLQFSISAFIFAVSLCMYRSIVLLIFLYFLNIDFCLFSCVREICPRVGSYWVGVDLMHPVILLIVILSCSLHSLTCRLFNHIAAPYCAAQDSGLKSSK